jgi:DNA-binding NtrC family response regulator
LSGVSGIDLAISMSKSQPDCRVILHSGEVVTSELLADAEARGYHFEILAKPIPPQELLDYLAASNQERPCSNR